MTSSPFDNLFAAANARFVERVNDPMNILALYDGVRPHPDADASVEPLAKGTLLSGRLTVMRSGHPTWWRIVDPVAGPLVDGDCPADLALVGGTGDWRNLIAGSSLTFPVPLPLRLTQ